MEEELASLPILHPDILARIFHKLPIKSICRCKLVCKEWSSLISDPFFRSLYNPSSSNNPLNLMMIPSQSFYNRKRNHNISSLTLEIDRPDSSVASRPQPLPSNFNSRDRLSVLGSWNGLVALYRNPGDFCLFNPYVPGKKIVVNVFMEEDDMYLRDYNVLLGLCHDPIYNEYKAVLSNSLCFDDPHSFYVVSFKYGDWKLKIQLGLRKLGPWNDKVGSTGTIVKGVPYWNCNNDASNGSVFYFDFKTEEFRLAPKVPNRKQILGLGTLDGRLTASVRADGGLEVWSLKELGDGNGSWSMLFVIANKLRSLSTLSWMKEVEVLLDVNGEELMIYNLRDRSLRQLQRGMKRSLHKIVAFIPTLI